MNRIARLRMETPRQTCSTCEYSRRYEDRHGFTWGPAEITYECSKLNQSPDPIDLGEVTLTDEQEQALDDGALGSSVDCPMWAEKGSDYYEY